MIHRIFIGWDSRFPEPALVLEHSIRRRTNCRLRISFLDYRHLHDCHRFNRAPDPLATTEFSYSRFLVPYLCNYEGMACFMDNDMVCLDDIQELMEMMPKMKKEGYVLRVRKHEQQVTSDTKFGDSKAPQRSYPRKNWSSLMLMDCSKLGHWSKDVVENAPGSQLHRFEGIPDKLIGGLPGGWNDLESQYRPGATKLLHYTEGGPWYAGCENIPNAEVWMNARREWLESIGRSGDAPLVPVRLESPKPTSDESLGRMFDQIVEKGQAAAAAVSSAGTVADATENTEITEAKS